MKSFLQFFRPFSGSVKDKCTNAIRIAMQSPPVRFEHEETTLHCKCKQAQQLFTNVGFYHGRVLSSWFLR